MVCVLFWAAFFAGFLFQATALLRGKGVSLQKVKEFVFEFLLLGLITSIVVYLSDPSAFSDLNSVIPVFFLVFLTIFAALFWDELMPVVSEKTVLVYSIAFAYLVLVAFGATIFSAIVLLPVAASVANAFVRRVLSFRERVFFYAWFIAVTIALGAQQVWQLLRGKNALEMQTGFEAFFLGASILFLGVNALFLKAFIPIPGEHQSFSDRLRQLDEYLRKASKKYSDFQMSFEEAAFTAVVLAGFLFFNHFFAILSTQLAVSLVVLLPQVWGRTEEVLSENAG